MKKIYIISYLDLSSKLHYVHPFNTREEGEQYANNNIEHICLVIGINEDKYESLKREILSNADKVDNKVIK